MYWRIRNFFEIPVFLVQRGLWTHYRFKDKDWAIKKAKELNREIDLKNPEREFPVEMHFSVTKRLGFKLEEVSTEI